MYDLDLKEFWAKDELAHRDNCFSPDAPQAALGIRMSEECFYAELGEEGNPFARPPRERYLELARRYNDKAETIVGRRLLPETLSPEDSWMPSPKGIGEVFGGRYEFRGSNWLMRGLHNEKELEQRLDFIDKLNFREFVLPENWEAEKKRIFETYGQKPRPWRSVRGPVTLACSVFGAEELIYLIMDEPDLARRFCDTIFHVIKQYIDLLDAERGGTVGDSRGFSFYDDDCNLLNPEMYELFGYPILKKVFDYVCPNPEDNRYQHSDSAMAHLLPILGPLNFTGCNFGPTVTVEEIRKYMPRTRIDGQLSPITFMHNDEEAIIAEVRRDCEAAKRTGRGLNVYTAGSINNGSLLTSMKAVMWAISEYGQY
ncbi:MAG: hypothetical protein FWD16_01425 [Clostridia bacterium]|nr:hypothetical protein [Clostridia bacterium]